MQSLDADFILRFGVSGNEATALAAIGFHSTRGNYYAHNRTAYTVEFPAGPLAIGSTLITSWDTEQRDSELLHVLSPTDCVRDRFMAYYAWGDLSALAAALSVAAAVGKRFEADAFVAWARREASDNAGYDIARLELFLARYRSGG